MTIQTTESDFDNYLPHNFLAEKMVLSCMLTNSEAIEFIIKTVNVSLFILKIIKNSLRLSFLCTKINC